MIVDVFIGVQVHVLCIYTEVAKEGKNAMKSMKGIYCYMDEVAKRVSGGDRVVY